MYCHAHKNYNRDCDIHLKKTDNEEIEGGKEGGDKLGKQALLEI